MTVFGGKTTKEVIKVKWVIEGGLLIHQDWCPYQKRKGHQEGTVYNPGKEPSGETSPTDTLILSF